MLGIALAFIGLQGIPSEYAAIAYMESMVKPRDWKDLPSSRAPIFRDPAL